MMKIVPSNENDAKINMLRNEKLLRYSYTVETITSDTVSLTNKCVT